MKLSIIILTKNEAGMIRQCLESVRHLADEIIVVDSGSIDDTVTIASTFGVQVVAVPAATDYATARNIGLKAASGDWIFYLDADERITPELSQEIKKAIHKPRATSYKLYRRNIIFGRFIKHGGYWPDPVHRLFKKEALVKWTGKLHESPQVTGLIGLITTPILHYTARSISAALDKARDWSAIEAQLLLDAHAAPVYWWKVPKAFCFKLFSQLILKGGILDGMPGLILAFIQAHHQASVLVHLWQKQQSSS